MGEQQDARTDRSARRVAMWLSVGLVAWSLIANLIIGDRLYTMRNLAWCVVLYLGATRNGVDRDALGLGVDRWRSGGIHGGLAAAVVAAVLLIGVALQDRVPGVAALLADERAHLSGPALWSAVLVRIPLGTALFEELAFRGVLLAVWWRAVGPGRAVVWSSVVFGLWHVAPTMVALQLNDVVVTEVAGLAAIGGSVGVTAIAGVGFAWLRIRSGSLLAPVLAHAAINALALLAAAGA